MFRKIFGWVLLVACCIFLGVVIAGVKTFHDLDQPDHARFALMINQNLYALEPGTLDKQMVDTEGYFDKQSDFQRYFELPAYKALRQQVANGDFRTSVEGAAPQVRRVRDRAMEVSFYNRITFLAVDEDIAVRDPSCSLMIMEVIEPGEPDFRIMAITTVRSEPVACGAPNGDVE